VEFNTAKTAVESSCSNDSTSLNGKELLGFRLPQLEQWAQENRYEREGETYDDEVSDDDEEDDEGYEDDNSDTEREDAELILKDSYNKLIIPGKVPPVRGGIPPTLLEYASLPTSHPHLFGYLSTEKAELIPERDEMGTITEKFRNMLTISANTNENVRVTYKKLIEEIPDMQTKI
jgi:hypothetical protein